jgi:hypothetical protein
MIAGEPHYSTDRGTLHVATDATTKLPVVPAIDDLTTLASVDGAADMLIMHDASASGVKECKITFNAFKTALAIPAGSTDEKVAVVSGGTPGFVWGTDGTDGVLRMNASMTWTKDASNGFVTLAVGVVDGGTFSHGSCPDRQVPADDPCEPDDAGRCVWTLGRRAVLGHGRVSCCHRHCDQRIRGPGQALGDVDTTCHGRCICINRHAERRHDGRVEHRHADRTHHNRCANRYAG